MLEEQGVRVGVAHLGLVVGVLVISTLGLHGSTGLTTVAALALVGGWFVSGGQGLAPWPLAVGLSAWAFFTGFLEHRFGQLTLAEPDLVRLALLVAVAAVGCALSTRPAGRSSRG